MAPAADHHKHLMGPGPTELRTIPPLPRVRVPEELSRLLSERARRWNDRSAIAELYTEDALLHDNRVPAWYQGRNEVAGFVIGRFRAGYHVTPVAFGMGPPRGYVAGYLTRYERGDTTHFMHVHQSLEKGAEGTWRIAAETFTYPGPQAANPLTAEQIVEELDSAGIRRGVHAAPSVISRDGWHPLCESVADADRSDRHRRVSGQRRSRRLFCRWMGE